MDGMNAADMELSAKQIAEIILRCFAEQTECRIENENGEVIAACWQDGSQILEWNFFIEENTAR